MKITLNLTDKGVETNIFIPKQEVISKNLLNLTNGVEKEYRVKRTFNLALTTQNISTLNTILEEVFADYNKYSQSNSLFNEDAVVELLKTSLKRKLDVQEHNNIELLLKIIVAPLLLNKASAFDIDTIRSRYDLNSKYDLLIGVVGNFGYGKTTLIKKLLGFDNTFKFLLVDGGRTTIYNTVVKGLFVKDGYIYQNDEAIKVDEYKFKNQITLHTKDYIYDNIIATNLYIPYLLFLETPFRDKTGVLNKFIEYSKCNLNSLFGDISTENDFYKSILAEFANLKDRGCGYEYDFKTNETLRKLFNDYYDNIVKTTLDSINECFNLTIDEDKINFTLTLDDLNENIDKIYAPFTDNDSKMNGKLLRLLVKEIYLEVNLDYANSFVDNNGGEVSPLKILNDDNNLKYHSFVFTDTVGCGHEYKGQNANGSTKYIDRDIIDNLSLLNECDVIYLLENATNRMHDNVKSQLYTLESLGLSNRVIVCYSHYNQFIKGDFSTDKDRENYLLNYFELGLVEMYNDNVEKAKSFYENFTSSTGDYNHKQIVFLKGLVPLPKPKLHKSTIKTRTKSNSVESIEYENMQTLNKDIYECNHCLSELIDKSIYIHKDILDKKQLTSPLINKSIEEGFSIAYHTQMYNTFLKNYLYIQKSIYIRKQTLSHIATEVLCNRCYNQMPYLYVNNVALRPFSDAIDEFTATLSTFFDNNPPIQNDEVISLSYINEVKAEVNSKITQLFFYLICNIYQNEWLKLANDTGAGVEVRRCEGIYNLLDSAFSNPTILNEVLKILRETVKKVVDKYNINLI